MSKLMVQPSTTELLNLAYEAVLEHRYERAQALAAIVSATAASNAAEELERIADAMILDDGDTVANLLDFIARNTSA